MWNYARVKWMKHYSRHMADEALVKKVQSLGDLELAILICLVAQEHCRIDTEPSFLVDLTRELEEIATSVFDLGHVVIECSKNTTVDDLNNAIHFSESYSTRPNSPIWNRRDNSSFKSITPSTDSHLLIPENLHRQRSNFKIVIVQNLDNAPKQVQTRALELMGMRTSYVSSRASTHYAPKQFLLIILLAKRNCPMKNKHLNDNIFISHFHHPLDRFTNLEENIDDEASISSVVKRSSAFKNSNEMTTPIISAKEIDHLRDLSSAVMFSIEVKQYQMNIVSFLRLHRAIAGGITAKATRLFDKLARCLAPLHNLNYITPSLISLAAKKIYTHRIQIVRPEDERSMQWGSEIETVLASLEGLSTEKILDEVLGNSGAEVPL